MPKYGKQLHINALLLIGITTFIPTIFSLDRAYNLQNQRYGHIEDVAKVTDGSRSKSQTTRIFTTDHELDEKFWLKYLGEDFRNAVHLDIDGENNAITLAEVKPPTPLTLNYKPEAEKRTRIVRQLINDDIDKQLPVENLYEQNDNENEEYLTETPDSFENNSNTSTTAIKTTTTTTATTTSATTTPPPTTSREEYVPSSTPPQFNNNKNPSRHKEKLLLHAKRKMIKVKPLRNYKVTNEPIVVHLPETDNTEHHIHEEHAPVIVQIPPVIYHQKADMYPENNLNSQYFSYKNQFYPKQKPKLPFSAKNIKFYSQQLQQNAPHFYPQHSTKYPPLSHLTHVTNLHNSRLQPSQQLHNFFPHTQYTSHSHMKQNYPYASPPPTFTLPKHSIPSPIVSKPSR